MENFSPLVHGAWAKWAGKQPNPRPSRITPGEDLMAGQKNGPLAG